MLGVPWSGVPEQGFKQRHLHSNRRTDSSQRDKSPSEDAYRLELDRGLRVHVSAGQSGLSRIAIAALGWVIPKAHAFLFLCTSFVSLGVEKSSAFHMVHSSLPMLIIYLPV